MNISRTLCLCTKLGNGLIDSVRPEDMLPVTGVAKSAPAASSLIEPIGSNRLCGEQIRTRHVSDTFSLR